MALTSEGSLKLFSKSVFLSHKRRFLPLFIQPPFDRALPRSYLSTYAVFGEAVVLLNYAQYGIHARNVCCETLITSNKILLRLR